MINKRIREGLIRMVKRGKGGNPKYPAALKLYQFGRYLIASDGSRFHIADLKTADPVPGADLTPADILDSVNGLIVSVSHESRSAIILPLEDLRQALVSGAELAILTVPLSGPLAGVVPVAEVASLTADLDLLGYAMIKGKYIPPNERRNFYRPGLYSQ